MAYLTVDVDEAAVLRLLQENHGLVVGDARGRHDVEFEPATANSPQVVSVTLQFVLSQDEVDHLIR